MTRRQPKIYLRPRAIRSIDALVIDARWPSAKPSNSTASPISKLTTLSAARWSMSQPRNSTRSRCAAID